MVKSNEDRDDVPVRWDDAVNGDEATTKTTNKLVDWYFYLKKYPKTVMTVLVVVAGLLGWTIPDDINTLVPSWPKSCECKPSEDNGLEIDVGGGKVEVKLPRVERE